MAQSIINKIIKSAALLGIALACQSSFAGVGIYTSVTNGTSETINLSSCIASGCDIADHEISGEISSGQTVKNHIYREASTSYYDSPYPYKISIPIYYRQSEYGDWDVVDGNTDPILVCNIVFTGTTYSNYGADPRIKNVGAISENKYNQYKCEVAPVKGESGTSGDTVYLSVTVHSAF